VNAATIEQKDAKEAKVRRAAQRSGFCRLLEGRTPTRYVAGVATAIFQKSGDWWAAYVEELPGVNTQDATLEEARENLQEALSLVLAANRELSRRDEPADCIREKIAVPA